MAKWIDCTLSDLGTIIGGATPSTKMEENYQNGHIPWITPKDLSVFRGRYISHGERNITQQGLKSCSTQLLPKHSILFSSRAPIGYIAIAECELCTNQGFKSIVPNERTDYMFLYYLLKFNKNAIENMGSGTTFKEVSGSTMKSIPVLVPVSIEEQKRIASTLSALDDKIEENDRINCNLAEQICALYTRLRKEKIWSICPIGQMAEKVAMGPFGSNIKVETFVDTGVPIISGNHLRSFLLEDSTYNFITEEHAAKLQNSIVFAKDIIFTHAGNIGQVAMIPDNCEYSKYVLSQRQFYLRCNTSLVLPEWVLMFFHSREGQHELLSFANQTGVPSIAQPASNLKKIEIPLPPIDTQREWLEIVSPMFSVIQQNKRTIQKLSSLRDTLLPKLMSGEIDVSKVEL